MDINAAREVFDGLGMAGIFDVMKESFDDITVVDEVLGNLEKEHGKDALRGVFMAASKRIPMTDLLYRRHIAELVARWVVVGVDVGVGHDHCFVLSLVITSAIERWVVALVASTPKEVGRAKLVV